MHNRKFTVEGEGVNELKHELKTYNRGRFCFKTGIILIIIGILVGILDLNFDNLLMIDQILISGITFGFTFFGLILTIFSYRIMKIAEEYIKAVNVFCLSCGQYVGDGFHTEERCDKCDSNRLTLDDPLAQD